MKLFTKFAAATLMLCLVAGWVVAQSSFNEVSPKASNTPIVTDDLFDLQFDWPVGVGGGEAGVETDGIYFYTSMWNGAGEFQKYDMDGTWVETFTVTGSDGCRDIAWDGTYFYGGAASTTVFQMDFDAATMISTFTAPTEVRAIAYNEDDDAFYANNWGSAITKFDMAGANLGSFNVGPTGDSYYGMAYQSDSYCGDGPFLWGYAQVGATQNELVQIELPSGTETGVYFDVGSVAGVGTGIAGGLAISDGFFANTWTIMGTAQNVNIWGLELCGDGVNFDPPQNVTAEVYDNNNVMVDWDAPGGSAAGTILCVDRDGSNPAGALDFTDDWQFIQPALDANGFTYDYYEVEDITTQDGPDLATLEQYDVVIWFCGEGWQGNQTMTDNDEANLSAYLNGGGSLLLSGIDYLWDRFPSAGSFSAGDFPYDYLGVASANQDNWSIFSPDVADFDGAAGSFAEGLSFSLEDIYTTGKDGLYIDELVSLDQDLLTVTNPSPAGNCAVQFDGGTFKSAFTSASAAAFVDPNDAIDFFAAAIGWLSPAQSDELTGYDVYRNGNMIGSTTTTSYDDTGLIPGTYEYCVKAVYDEGTSIAECADEVIVEGSGGDCLFDDDFESYNVGEQLVSQNPVDWTTWSNDPGSSEDPYIVDNGGQVVEITDANDLVYVIPNFTSGFYTISFDMYVPDGYDGYFNTLQQFAGASSEWGMQVYFYEAGGSVDAGGAAAATFDFPYDTWMAIRVEVDLDNDWAEFYLDDELIHGWVWSTGSFGTGSLNQLGGSNFFAGSDTQEPLYHIDNYCLAGEEPPTLLPPTELTGPAAAVTGEDINLEWTAPATGAILQWDDGINDDAIGLTDGGTFSVASHWEPGDLTEYDGMMLEKIAFFAGDYPGLTFTMKVWTGTGATEVLSQAVSSYVQNDWNEIVLDNPIMIDASQDFWFGYETTHAAGEYPAGCDAGPAIQNYGDMILNGGSWESLYVLTGGVIDANWNLIGTASIADGKAALNQQTVMTKPAAVSANSSNFELAGTNAGQGKKYVPAASKELQGYNVYRDGSMLDFTTETNYTDNVSVSGTYEYYVTAVYDAGESDPSNTWTVDVTTGIEEALAKAIHVFPNPATDVVNIQSDFNINAVSVYNYTGQLINVEKVNKTEYRFNSSSLNTGIYFFQIETEEGMISRQIIIE